MSAPALSEQLTRCEEPVEPPELECRDKPLQGLAKGRHGYLVGAPFRDEVAGHKRSTKHVEQETGEAEGPVGREYREMETAAGPSLSASPCPNERIGRQIVETPGPT